PCADAGGGPAFLRCVHHQHVLHRLAPVVACPEWAHSRVSRSMRRLLDIPAEIFLGGRRILHAPKDTRGAACRLRGSETRGKEAESARGGSISCYCAKPGPPADRPESERDDR